MYRVTAALFVYLSQFVLLSNAKILLVPQEYSTIQSAIDASANGDTIHISAGRYVESVDSLGKAITGEGEGNGQTVIEPWPDYTAFLCSHGEGTNTVVRNITFRNGGIAFNVIDSSPTFTNN